MGGSGILEALYTQPPPKTPKSPSPTPLKPPKHLKHQHYGWFGHTRGVIYPTTTQNPQITITDTPKTTQTPKSPTLWVVLAYHHPKQGRGIK